jgi:hypothetical protein
MNVYKEILKVGTIDISLQTDGLSLYDSASLSYEQHNYLLTEQYCEQARTKFSAYTQSLREAKAGLNTNVEILDVYSRMLDEEISIYLNLYEACEHFESASRFYETYYNHYGTNEDYEMGGNEIDSMNEKISAHDSAVGRYNDLLAEYSIELKRLIG